MIYIHLFIISIILFCCKVKKDENTNNLAINKENTYIKDTITKIFNKKLDSTYKKIDVFSMKFYDVHDDIDYPNINILKDDVFFLNIKINYKNSYSDILKLKKVKNYFYHKKINEQEGDMKTTYIVNKYIYILQNKIIIIIEDVENNITGNIQYVHISKDYIECTKLKIGKKIIITEHDYDYIDRIKKNETTVKVEYKYEKNKKELHETFYLIWFDENDKTIKKRKFRDSKITKNDSFSIFTDIILNDIYLSILCDRCDIKP